MQTQKKKNSLNFSQLVSVEDFSHYADQGSGGTKKGTGQETGKRLDQTVRTGVKTAGNIQHSGLAVKPDEEVASLLSGIVLQYKTFQI